MPDTSKQARAALVVADDAWQQAEDVYWASVMAAPSGERWVVVRTTPGEERVRATLRRQVEQARQQWEQALWHLGHRQFACAPDAQAALEQQLKQRPEWLEVQAHLVAPSQSTRSLVDPARTRRRTRAFGRSRPRSPSTRRRSCGRHGARHLSGRDQRPRSPQLPDQELIQTYKDQHSVERGFSFLKDPLFLASSVFVKKPERIVALSLVMVLCLLVYRLAEHRLREQLAATGQTIPSQVNKPTTARRCAGSSSASKGSICSTSATDPIQRWPSCSVWSPSTSRCSRSSDPPMKNSTNRPIERAESGF